MLGYSTYKKSFSIFTSFNFIVLNFIVAFPIYIFFKIEIFLLKYSIDKHHFLYLSEIFTNLIMVVILLWISVEKLGVNIKENIISFKKEIINILKLSLPFIFYYLAFVFILYYLKISDYGFNIFKATFRISVLKDIIETKLFFMFFLVFVDMCLLIPVKEEIIMRRFLYVSLRKRFNFIFSTFINSLLFGILHGSIITSFVYGIIACYVYERYNNLKINIFMHSIINFLIISIFLLNQ